MSNEHMIRGRNEQRTCKLELASFQHDNVSIGIGCSCQCNSSRGVIDQVVLESCHRVIVEMNRVALLKARTRSFCAEKSVSQLSSGGEDDRVRLDVFETFEY